MRNVLFGVMFSTITILGIVQVRKDSRIKKQQWRDRYKANHPFKYKVKKEYVRFDTIKKP